MFPLTLRVHQEENGYIVMLAVFDTVDDTALVKKALLRVSCKSLAVSLLSLM